MKRLAIVAAVALGLAAGSAQAERLKVKLSGYEETPQTLSSPGFAEFDARIGGNDDSISWQLTYRDLPTDVLQAHIHFGQRATTGGISIFLCTNVGGGPAGTQPCPQMGTIGGMIDADDVIGPGGQGISPGELEEIIAAIRAGYAYVNIHTKAFPSGELRGQFEARGHRGDHGRD